MSSPPAPEELARRADEQKEADLRDLARIAARDAAGLTSLYDRHAALLFGLLIRIAGRAAAERLLEQVFARLWDGADVYDAALGSPRAWLVGLARHQAFDWLRAHGEAGDHGDHADLHDWPEASGERRAAAVFHSLAAEERSLIEYAFFRGLSHGQLAEHFGLPVDTVKMRLRHGMHMLIEMLAKLSPGTRRES